MVYAMKVNINLDFFIVRYLIFLLISRSLVVMLLRKLFVRFFFLVPLTSYLSKKRRDVMM